MKKPLIIFLNSAFLILNSFCFSQQNKIDSLLILLKTDKADTNKLNHLNKLSREYDIIGSYDSAMINANTALQLSNVILKNATDPQIQKTAQKSKANAYRNIGNGYSAQGNYNEALKNYFTGLKICEAIGYQEGLGYSYNNIGLVYASQGNYPEALKNQLSFLKIIEASGNRERIANSYNNIGLVYASQGNYPEALKNYFASLKIMQAIGNKAGIADSYNNTGSVYFYQGNYPDALKQYFASLKIFEALGNKDRIANSYNNIGTVYSFQGNYPEALKNSFASLKIREAIGDKAGVASSCISIGEAYSQQKKYKEAEGYFIKAKEISKEIGYKEHLKNIYIGLTELYSAQGNFKDAYENQKLFMLYRDSLDNEETRKKIVQLQMTSDFEKKEAATKAEQDKKDAITAEEKQKQKAILILVTCFLFMVLLLALFILRGYRQKQKANIIITQQKTEVEKQKHVIQEKNKDITDSINYAKRIQQAMLPNHSDILAAFPESFVLFKPKDIVSGDFYFFHKKPLSFWGGSGGAAFFIAAADCTGHGVPGAFMSMIGAGKLNDAVHQSSDASEILSLLNRGIKTSLKQNARNESTRDGMDIALCAVDTENRIVKYAAANRPIWIIKNGKTEVEEIKATKKAIGGFTEDSQHYETHEIKLQKGDTIYLSTDGFADTFSGKTNKKLTTKKFKEILIGIQDKTMREQGQYLDNFIEDWRAGTEQVDDILVIGVQL